MKKKLAQFNFIDTRLGMLQTVPPPLPHLSTHLSPLPPSRLPAPPQLIVGSNASPNNLSFRNYILGSCVCSIEEPGGTEFGSADTDNGDASIITVIPPFLKVAAGAPAAPPRRHC
jgi:hypothetical protein